MDIVRPPVSRVAPAADGTPGGRGGSERGFAEAAVRDGAESWLRLAGLHCAACAITIEEALRGVEGVQQVEVNAASARARVSWDPARTRPSALVDAVRAAAAVSGSAVRSTGRCCGGCSSPASAPCRS